MKRHAALIVIVALGLVALVVTEMRRVGTPVSPGSLFRWLAGAQREVTRVPAVATRMSDEDEIRVGNGLAAEYEVRFQAGDNADNREVQDYVSLVGMRVAGRAHRKLPYKFHYIPDRSFINAFALPGGHVFIGEGLIVLMDSEDEMAAVLGHELEHVDHYHCAERAQTEAALRKSTLCGPLAIRGEVFAAGYTKDRALAAEA